MATKQTGTTGNLEKLYYDTAGSEANPTWSEVKRVKDLNTPLTKSEADMSRRESSWKLYKGALKDGSIEFTYVYKCGTDAVYDALLDSYVNGTALQLAAMDQAITETGARGFDGWFEVFDLSHDQPLEDGAMINVVAKPADNVAASSGSDSILVEPELLTVS